MREIKFRGQGLAYQWFYGALSADGKNIVELHEGSNGIQHELYHEVDPKTVGQFTGLRDCYGKEIYEGDIVEFSASLPYSNGRDKTVMVPVEFYNGAFEARQGSIVFTIRNFAHDVKIVGNKFPNPNY